VIRFFQNLLKNFRVGCYRFLSVLAVAGLAQIIIGFLFTVVLVLSANARNGSLLHPRVFDGPVYNVIFPVAMMIIILVCYPPLASILIRRIFKFTNGHEIVNSGYRGTVVGQKVSLSWYQSTREEETIVACGFLVYMVIGCLWGCSQSFMGGLFWPYWMPATLFFPIYPG
jgi:hypothetical protein